MASPSVEDRLAERRGRLQKYCLMEPVKQHMRVTAYHQMARQLFQQMEAYVADEAWDQAYVYLARFVKLCSKVIPMHVDYNNPKYEKERKWISSHAEQGLKLFDVILKGMEESELELMEEEREQARRRSAPPTPTATTATTATRPSSSSWAPPPPSSAHLTLEDRFAALRLRKAQDARASVAEAEKRVEPTKLRSTYTGGSTDRYSVPRAEPEPRLARSTVSYPTVTKAHWMQDDLLGSATASVRRRPRRPVNRQASQEALSQLSSGQLRTLEIPSYIISEFTAIADPNTRRYPDGIETCGILAGKLHGTKLVITTLIIPKQEGSSDMCTMKNEEELFDYCFSNDLLTLGWIHTHPRQNCFLSSVDIHTQCGFQSMLPEAIAIVVAPTDMRRNVGVFRLTEPGGMQLIQQCTLQGFHVHPEHIQIYSDAMACEWNAHSRSSIVDMR